VLSSSKLSNHVEVWWKRLESIMLFTHRNL
jgi:hypothetical protein